MEMTEAPILQVKDLLPRPLDPLKERPVLVMQAARQAAHPVADARPIQDRVQRGPAQLRVGHAAVQAIAQTIPRRGAPGTV